MLRRKEDRFLLGMQIGIYALLFFMFFAFQFAPLFVKALMIWVGALVMSRYESVLHWSIHYPVFRSQPLNKMHRLSFCVMPMPAIFYRYEH